ncbi:hypothetical protein EMIT0P294_160010 [Pseudomonas sp. IT-P294]
MTQCSGRGYDRAQRLWLTAMTDKTIKRPAPTRSWAGLLF